MKKDLTINVKTVTPVIISVILFVISALQEANRSNPLIRNDLSSLALAFLVPTVLLSMGLMIKSLPKILRMLCVVVGAGLILYLFFHYTFGFHYPQI